MSDTRRTVQRHPIAPVWDETSRILILGSFPSVKSREANFFYGHPQNRFWRVLAAVLGCDKPESTEEKKRFLLSHHIAVWDVIGSCEIAGSADSSIRSAQPNDIAPLLAGSGIRRIFTNGKTAHALYVKQLEPKIGRPAVPLPSTSPANAACGFERLTDEWRQILEWL